MAGDGLLGYGELAELLGKSVGAVTLAGLLDSGAPVPAAGRSVAPEPRSAPPAPPAAPGMAAPVPPPAPVVPEDAEDRRRRGLTIAEVLACPHPDDERRRLGYMTMCVRCGRRQTGRDEWSGAGYAGWDAAELAACPHPEEGRRRHSWGTTCGACGKRVPA